MYDTQSILHIAISFATLPHNVLWVVDFGVIAITMEGSYNNGDIVAEDEVTSALSYLNMDCSLNTTTGSTNALSNQQMARRYLSLKRYNKKHHYVCSIKQNLSILQVAIKLKNIRSTAHKYKICSWRKQVNELKTKSFTKPNLENHPFLSSCRVSGLRK
jgi:hypothetical protein